LYNCSFFFFLFLTINENHLNYERLLEDPDVEFGLEDVLVMDVVDFFDNKLWKKLAKTSF